MPETTLYRRADGTGRVEYPSGRTEEIPDTEAYMTEVAAGRAFPYRLGALTTRPLTASGWTAVVSTLSYSAARGEHVKTERIIAVGVSQPRADTLIRRRGASAHPTIEGERALLGITRTWVNGVLQPPAHEDETDCPSPATCRAHDWLVRS